MRMSHLSAAVLAMSRFYRFLLFTRARIIRSQSLSDHVGIKVRAWHAAAHRRAGARSQVPKAYWYLHTR